MSNDASQQTRRTPKAVTIVGLAGITGGLVLGGTLVATAANPTGFASTATECTSAEATVVPQVPYFSTSFTTKGNLVQGTVPVPTAQQLGALTAKNVLVRLTTQYSTSGSGGGGKSDRVTVTGANGTFFNPIGGTPGIPPVVNQGFVSPTTPTPYSAKTTGKAAVKITVEAFIGDATRTVKTLTLGTTCPAGSTATGSIEGQITARPAAPTNVTATAGGTPTPASNNGQTPADNGTVTVTFTGVPAANQGGQTVQNYRITANDITVPSAGPFIFTAPAGAPGAARSVVVSSLNTAHTYTFVVNAETVDSSSLPSNTTGPVTPTATPGGSNPPAAQAALRPQGSTTK